MSHAGLDPAASLRRLIALHGPISLQRFMGEANARYYDSRDPLGHGAATTAGGTSGGDFITAPEISQMFGELIGLWLTDMWDRAGRPARVLYVELGPGRGTLARDALRVMRRHGLMPELHLVEGSRVLSAVQRTALGPDAGATWHADLASVPGADGDSADGSNAAPLLLVANEFMDALPIRQLVKTPHGWRERMVGLEDGRLVPVAGAVAMDAAVPADLAGDHRALPDGTIVETCPGAIAITAEIARRLDTHRGGQGGAALAIDYGHTQPRTGSTLQAVRAHARVDPFATPGEADLTAHVDFAALAQAAQAHGARWLGTTTQGAWLRALGIGARAGALTTAAPARAIEIAAAHDRLVADDAMGTLFKVMGLASPDWPSGAGFGT